MVEKILNYRLWVGQGDVTESVAVDNHCSNGVVSCESDNDLVGKAGHGGTIRGTSFDGYLGVSSALLVLLKQNGFIQEGVDREESEGHIDVC
jgi:hypothetical protein